MSLLRRQHGFTLIEALVAMSLAMVVFGATLTILDVYMRQSNGVTQRFDAQNQVRLATDRIVRQLRNVASPLTSPKLLERATRWDLEFQTIGSPSGSNAAGTERVRYCIPQDTASGSAAKEELVSETETWTSANPPADPWSSDPTVSIPCPDSLNGAQGGGVMVSQSVIAQSVVNRYKQTGPTGASASQPSFSYNNGTLPEGNDVLASDLPNISTIQVNLWVNPTPKVAGATTEVQSSAYLRNKEHSPVANFTPSPIGNGSVILNGGTSFSPDGQQLSFAWLCDSSSPTPCPTNTSLDSATDGLVTWNPGPGTYNVTMTVTDEDNLSTPYTATVIVT